MIINNECARELIKECGNLAINESMVLNEFLEHHSEFNEQDVVRAAYYLNRCDLLVVNGAKYYDENLEVDKYIKVKLALRYRDIIPYSLFDDKIWEELKKKVDIQKYNFTMLLDLLVKKSVLELNQTFDIPNDLVVKVN